MKKGAKSSFIRAAIFPILLATTTYITPTEEALADKSNNIKTEQITKTPVKTGQIRDREELTKLFKKEKTIIPAEELKKSDSCFDSLEQTICPIAPLKNGGQ